MRRRSGDQLILKMLNDQSEVDVADFCAALDLSQATVRRRLSDLEARGLLRRTHGGATLEGLAAIEPQFDDKANRHRPAKEAIANRALQLIEDGDQIYLDGGSTVVQLASLLSRRRNLTIVTNSLMAAECLRDTEHVLILVGGRFRSRSRVTVGTLTTAVLEQLHLGKAFLGTMGYNTQFGMTTTDSDEAFTKALVMRRARQVILLADHSKFNATWPACSGRPESIHTLVTNAIEPAFQRELSALGIQILLPEELPD